MFLKGWMLSSYAQSWAEEWDVRVFRFIYVQSSVKMTVQDEGSSFD